MYCNAAFSDNPMQSEVASHIGGKGNCFCRKCRVGGNQKDKATNEGYHALFAVSFRLNFHNKLNLYQAGIPRTKEYIILELEKQVKLACSGVIKPVKDLQTDTGVKDAYTQFWIDGLISRFKEMRKDEPNRSSDEIRDELVQWTVANRDSIYSGFLTTKGCCSSCLNFAYTDS
jgi:cysteinyl-tRNA synthetase